MLESGDLPVVTMLFVSHEDEEVLPFEDFSLTVLFTMPFLMKGLYYFLRKIKFKRS
jgi:hypothetical protein